MKLSDQTQLSHLLLFAAYTYFDTIGEFGSELLWLTIDATFAFDIQAPCTRYIHRRTAVHDLLGLTVC